MRCSMPRVIRSGTTIRAMITSTHSTARITQAMEYWGGAMISGGAGSARISATSMAVLPRAQHGDHVLDQGGLALGEHRAEVQAVQHLGDALRAGPPIGGDVLGDPLRGAGQGADLAGRDHVDH